MVYFDVSSWPTVQTTVQFIGEVIGALPRMVVILVVALLLPMDWRSLMPLAIVWAILCALGAIDEAGAVGCPFGWDTLCGSIEGTWFWCLADLYAAYCSA